MLTRRFLLATPPALMAPAILVTPSRAQGNFQTFLGGIREEAQRHDVSRATLDQAFANIQPNPKVIALDRKQPEFTMTWEQYHARVISDQRIADGRAARQANAALLRSIEERFGVDPRVVAGIWGLESHFGTKTGGFQVIEAVATLAWEGRRASFFRAELLAALRILENRDIAIANMSGSYAGAMGQPQFMPTSFLRLAVDFDGDGRKDIWNSRPDALASIANYLQKSGWIRGESWGQKVLLPTNLPTTIVGRNNRRSLNDWRNMGIQLLEKPRAGSTAPSAIIQPDGQGNPAFLIYKNFDAIKRYNPSDFYALAVGLIGDQIGA
ncbi:MAG: lytic murein transglycosylase [Acetobacteraceae bacterium]|nr:lytic murein transglycosylase [Acetobacteraceae bacterium]